MSAPQDAWAVPLAKDLVDLFRSTAFRYIKVSLGAYDETTGSIGITEQPFDAAGAVVKTEKVQRDGTMQANELEAWIDHTTVPWPCKTGDEIEYQGLRWHVIEVAPSYGSSDTIAYASKIIARAE